MIIGNLDPYVWQPEEDVAVFPSGLVTVTRRVIMRNSTSYPRALAPGNAMPCSAPVIDGVYISKAGDSRVIAPGLVEYTLTGHGRANVTGSLSAYSEREQTVLWPVFVRERVRLANVAELPKFPGPEEIEVVDMITNRITRMKVNTVLRWVTVDGAVTTYPICLYPVPLVEETPYGRFVEVKEIWKPSYILYKQLT